MRRFFVARRWSLRRAGVPESCGDETGVDLPPTVDRKSGLPRVSVRTGRDSYHRVLNESWLYCSRLRYTRTRRCVAHQRMQTFCPGIEHIRDPVVKVCYGVFHAFSVDARAGKPVLSPEMRFYHLCGDMMRRRGETQPSLGPGFRRQSFQTSCHDKSPPLKKVCERFVSSIPLSTASPCTWLSHARSTIS